MLILSLAACTLITEHAIAVKVGVGRTDSGTGDSTLSADSGPPGDTGADTAADSGADTASADADGDGYTIAQGDCDDADPAVNPGAAEDCATPADDNCDGSTNDPNATGCTMLYADADGDHYGGTDSACLCTITATYSVTIGGDCDDANSAVNPSAVEICENFVDDNCDGSAGACALGGTELSGADAEYTGEAAGDYAGYGLAAVGDVNGDGYDDFVVGADGVGNATTTAGAAYLILGGPVPLSASLSTADAKYVGEAVDDNAGYYAAGAGDVNGDGYADFLVGSIGNKDGGGTYTGSAYLILGSAHPRGGSLSGAVEFVGEVADDMAGPVAGAGDVDGDGFADFLVGASGSQADGYQSGRAYLILGSARPRTEGLGGADTILSGGEGYLAGDAIAGGGDVDGDGADDFLVGARRAGDSGAAYLVLGGALPDSLALATDAVAYNGAEGSDDAGGAVAIAGDVNGDGYADIAVGAYNAPAGASTGIAYLVLGSAGPASRSLSLADAEFDGGTARGYGYVGRYLSGAGDLDGDGFDDILIGGANSAAYLVRGGTSVAGTADTDDGSLTRCLGSAGTDGEVITVGGPADVDGDGFDDLLVGAPDNAEVGTDAGAAYLILGTGW